MKKDFRRDAKVLLVDLEVGPDVVAGYGSTYEFKPIKTLTKGVLLAFSYKWYGDKGKPEGFTINQFKQADRFDDTGIVRELWKLFDEANAVCAYNGDRFDIPVSKTFFLLRGLPKPSPWKVIDPIKTARREFRFPDNKLNTLAEILLGQTKTETTYGDCWYPMYYGNDAVVERYSKLMDKYCRNDVVLLEGIYTKLLPWMSSPVNFALLSGVGYVCPRCGYDSDFRVKSYRHTGVQVTGLNYECLHCHGFVERRLTKEERKELEAERAIKTKYRALS